MKTSISMVETIIQDAREGRMFILIDDERRENEGDLVIPAQKITPQAINFMATHGRGLICLAMDSAEIDRLGLPLMVHNNTSHLETAFTVSIDAKEGISTGISAADRAHTIQVAANPKNTKEDLVVPGHIFPLRARKGGTLERLGHTEASVDISKLAGLSGTAVICEIMNEDGSMARLPDLIRFAERHNLKIGTITDLAYYLKRRKLAA